MSTEAHAVADPDELDRRAWQGHPIHCANCDAEIIKGYDGRGTGWRHIYPETSPLWLHSGDWYCYTPPVSDTWNRRSTNRELTWTVLAMIAAAIVGFLTGDWSWYG